MLPPYTYSLCNEILIILKGFSSNPKMLARESSQHSLQSDEVVLQDGSDSLNTQDL